MNPEAIPREAALIVPVFRTTDGELRLLFVRRSAEGVHGGQIAFPGGMRDPGDESLRHTALRELDEEMAVGTEAVEVVAALPPARTLTTGIIVHPFLGRLLQPGRWTASPREVAEVFEIPVEYLARPEAHDFGVENFPGWPEPLRLPHYRIGGHRAWGLTYRILEPLIPRLLAAEWEL